MSSPLLGQSLAIFELHRRPMSPREMKALTKMRAKLQKLKQRDAGRMEKALARERERQVALGNPLPVVTLTRRNMPVISAPTIVKKVSAKELALH